LATDTAGTNQPPMENDVIARRLMTELYIDIIKQLKTLLK